MNDNERLARLKERFAYDRWPATDDYSGAQPEIAAESLIPDWKLVASDADKSEGLPPSTRTLFQASEDDPSRLLVIDIFECGSPSEAREFLLEQLDQFESPLMERLEGDEALGEVGFSHPGRFVALFARGSRVVVLKNGGSEPIPVLDIAGRIDDSIAGKQEQ